jgi:WD40 repeat protein
VEALAYAPAGARIAVGRGGARAAPVTLWSAEKPKKLSDLDGYKGGVTSLAWSPDGKRLAAACEDWALRVWDTATGKLAQTLVGHGDDVLHVQWSPDGATLLSVSRDDTLRLWRARNGLLIHGYRLSQPALRAPFWPDGQGFVVPSAEGLRVLPRRSAAFEGDPRALLKNAQQRAGRELRGFSLHTPR